MHKGSYHKQRQQAHIKIHYICCSSCTTLLSSLLFVLLVPCKLPCNLSKEFINWYVNRSALPSTTYRYTIEKFTTNEDRLSAQDDVPYTCRMRVDFYNNGSMQKVQECCDTATGRQGLMVCTRSIPPICLCQGIPSEAKAKDFKTCASKYKADEKEDISCTNDYW